MIKFIRLILILLILPVKGFGQHQFKINVDSVCFQSTQSKQLKGLFGLYGDMRIENHPFWVKDTLIKKLQFKAEQILDLEDMPYTLRFIPKDSTQITHSVPIHARNKNISLSCFFFDKSYSYNFKTMKHNDYVQFVSKYAGPTNMDTRIPIYTLIIIKKRRNYYASFQQSFTNEQGLRFGDIQTRHQQNKKIKIDKSYIKLSDSQLKTIEDFWNKVDTYWLDQDYNSIPSQTYIYHKNGFFNFQAKKYISKLLWEKLNKSHQRN